MSAESPIHIEPTEEAWREIDELVERIAGLARENVPPEVFYRELLDGTVRTLAAAGGAVWLSDRPGQLDLRYQIKLEVLGLREPWQQARHDRLVASTISAGATRAYPPHAGSSDPEGAANPSDFLLLICPLLLDGQPVGAVEIAQRGDTDPAAYRGNERLLAMVGELALEYQRNRQLADYRRQLEQSERLDQFARRVHAPLDPLAVAYEIANEGRRLIDCDRLSVAVPRRRRLRLAAISGVDVFDRRAGMVRRLESLIGRVAVSAEPFWYTGDWSAVPPQLEGDLREYLDESHVRSLAIWPLRGGAEEDAGEEGDDVSRPRRGDSLVGALVVERFDAALDGEAARQVATVARHSRVALGNSEEYRSLPLLSVSRGIRGLLAQFHADRLPRSLAVLAAACLLVAILLLVPAPFRVESRGQLQPALRQNIYAPEDGEVRRLHVQHNEAVQSDQPLLELVSTDLELEMQRAETERLTTKKQLESIGILRVTEDPAADAAPTRREELSAQELEITQLLQSQERQLEIIQRQRRSLVVRSPLAGRVLTWDLERLLAGRPVQRGELLMRVGDLDGPWLAELEVPDQRIGHVLNAARHQEGDLTVSFILGTNPARSYRATVTEIAETAVPDSEGRPVVMVRVRVEEPIPERHPGATVIARIHCGYRPLGYVWLHDLIDAVRARLLF